MHIKSIISKFKKLNLFRKKKKELTITSNQHLSNSYSSPTEETTFSWSSSSETEETTFSWGSSSETEESSTEETTFSWNLSSETEETSTEETTFDWSSSSETQESTSNHVSSSSSISSSETEETSNNSQQNQQKDLKTDFTASMAERFQCIISPPLQRYLKKFDSKPETFSQLFEKYHISEEEKFCCPISRCIMDKPVLLHNKHFDFPLLEKLPCNNEGKRIHPLTRDSFLLIEIQPYYDICTALQEKIDAAEKLNQPSGENTCVRNSP